MKDKQELTSREKEVDAGRGGQNDPGAGPNTSIPGLVKWIRLWLELGGWKLGFGMELMRVEMRTRDLTVESSRLATSRSWRNRTERQAIPLESLWFSRARGKKTAEDKPKLSPRAGQNPGSHLGCPPLSSKSEPFFCDFFWLVS